jgi:pectin methylesterase-like acyl-CoA thioesterase
MRRILSIIFALALVLAFSLVATTPVAAATPIYVNAARPDNSGDGTSWLTAKKTITAGISVVDVGGTVIVAAGTYTETVIVNKANLTLSGPNAGVNPNTGTRGAEAVIAPTAAGSWPDVGAVSVRSNGVTIDGFEVDGSGGSQNGINVYGASDVTVKNNIVHGVSHTWDGIGILVWDWDSAYTVDRATIENNEVYDTGRMGIFCMDYDTTNSKYDLTEGHVIRGNTVHDTWKKGDAWSDAGGAIQINVGKDCAI